MPHRFSNYTRMKIH